MKVKFKIPYAKQEISHTDITNVSRVLKSDFITQGPKILEFERKVATIVPNQQSSVRMLQM